MDDVSVTDRSGREVEVADNGDGTWSFTQPGSAVTITVTFRPVESEPEALPFTDVSESEWYYEAVRYVWSHGLMDGVGEGVFAPEADTSRAMVVTVLWRLEGQPESAYEMGYTDVEGGTWYTEAVRWATEQGIVDGYENGAFRPDGAMTREEVAAVLYRYAAYKRYSTSDQGDMGQFDDQEDISAWARDYMVWAVGSGLMEGSGTRIDPQDSAIRAQTAAVLMRFAENVAK